MSTLRLTYNKLFALLASLGFNEESSETKDQKQPRVFVHTKTDTVLLFRRATSEAVSDADMLSTEVHLHANNIADKPLSTLLDSLPVTQ